MVYEVPQWNFDDTRVIGESSYRKHRITTYQLPDAIPVLGSAQPITIDVYVHKSNRPMLITHPVVGSKHNEVAVLFAKLFCLLGWNAVIVHRGRHPMEGKTPQEFETLLRKIIYNDIQVEQFLRHKGLMDPRRTISFGASLGGVSNALLTSVLPYKGFVCVVSGGPIAEVMARMDDPGVAKWRQERIRELGYSGVEEFQQKYAEAIQTDTLKLANKKANVMLFSGMFDRIVPASTQRKLSLAFGRFKPCFWFPTGHLTIFLFLPIIVPLMAAWSYYTVYLKR
jgi:hypothetical protein